MRKPFNLKSVSRRTATVFLACAMIGLGVWQIGQAGYIHLKAKVAQVLVQDAWAETLTGQSQVRPWPWADTWPVARLQIPELDVDLMVLAGANGPALAFGPAHLVGTAAPGTAGHSILAGHRDTHFAFLQKVEDGTQIRVQSPDGAWRDYSVTDRQVIDSRYARLASGNGEAALTLVTCYPFDTVVPGGPLRYLVSAFEQQESAWMPPDLKSRLDSKGSTSTQPLGEL
ncbi:class GN sortase [Pelagibius sp. Alg239-R121]|uniref:class GN sortase n=1 Tax=Pelagibius sp. Alg239-R121 TaxID=2993448 RepID=UPI0024A68439|nr:class GN sortase [Pelagibius sp. Alg239-R121]